MSPALIGWAAEALVASALLMALVLALRTPVRRAFGAQAAYALWALPVLRLVLPPLPAAWREGPPAMARAREQIIVLIADPARAAPLRPVIAPVRDWLPSAGAALLSAWLAGVALFLAAQWLAHARFCRRILADPRRLDRIGSVDVIASAAAPGPLAFGVWRRYVAVPRDFDARYDPRERSLALAHELGHHLRGDLLANWIALVVLALHWFNPLAWRAMRAFRQDQEMANDARVLASASPALRHAYGCAIVKAAHGRALSPACHLNTAADLKGRLRMLTRSTSRRRLALGAAAVAALTLAGLGATASGTATAATIRAGVSHIAPLPPVPAVPPVAPAVAQDDLAPPPPPPAAPPAPITPNAHPVPPAPPAPPVLDDKAFAALRDMPQIDSRDCPADASNRREITIERRDQGRRHIIICTNRLEAARDAARDAARAAVGAEETRREAMRRALDGLTRTRAELAANRDMREAMRQEVLASIDQSMAELQAEMAGQGDR